MEAVLIGLIAVLNALGGYAFIRAWRRIEALESDLKHERSRIDAHRGYYWDLDRDVDALASECGFIKSTKKPIAPRWERKL